jgi:RNAse (barnase) inhibitor barstar
MRPYTFIVITSRVSIDCRALRDWTSFHSEFARVFGFPAFYGKNMNAWIDCMTSLDVPDDGMSTVHCELGTVLTLELNNASDFASRCPEQYEALVHCAEFVNTRRVEVGETAVLVLDLKS